MPGRWHSSSRLCEGGAGRAGRHEAPRRRGPGRLAPGAGPALRGCSAGECPPQTGSAPGPPSGREGRSLVMTWPQALCEDLGSQWDPRDQLPPAGLLLAPEGAVLGVRAPGSRALRSGLLSAAARSGQRRREPCSHSPPSPPGPFAGSPPHPEPGGWRLSGRGTAERQECRCWACPSRGRGRLPGRVGRSQARLPPACLLLPPEAGREAGGARPRLPGGVGGGDGCPGGCSRPRPPTERVATKPGLGDPRGWSRLLPVRTGLRCEA